MVPQVYRARVHIDEMEIPHHSALQAIDAIAAKYELAGKKLMLRHLSRDCHALLTKAGQLIVDMDDDPSYRIATDYRILAGKIGGH